MSLALDSASPTAVYSGIMFFMVSGREKIECVVAASALLGRARIKSLSPYGLLACFRKYAAEVEAAALDKYARGEFDRLGRLIVDDLAPARSRTARPPLPPETPPARATEPPPVRAQAPPVRADDASAFRGQAPAVRPPNTPPTRSPASDAPALPSVNDIDPWESWPVAATGRR